VGVSISDLPAGVALNDTDVIEIEQAGVSKKITRVQLAAALLPTALALNDEFLPQNGDVVYYDGTDFRTGSVPRWRVIDQAAYTESAVATSSTITFAGGGPTGGIKLKGGDYFAVGYPVRAVIAATEYYGICTAISDTLLTISGAILPTGTAITSLAVGSLDMVKHVQMEFCATGYNGSSTLVLTKGCQHRWHGPTGYLCQYAVMHMNTSATTVVQLQMNGGSNVSSTGVIPAAGTATTYGAAVASANGTLVAANLAISHNQTITAKTPTVGGSADFLIINMMFVIP
jgi:hypothetical protein